MAVHVTKRNSSVFSGEDACSDSIISAIKKHCSHQDDDSTVADNDMTTDVAAVADNDMTTDVACSRQQHDNRCCVCIDNVNCETTVATRRDLRICG